MVDVQARGPGGIAGSYGIWFSGLTYSVSSGTNGIQAQGQIVAFGIAVTRMG